MEDDSEKTLLRRGAETKLLQTRPSQGQDYPGGGLLHELQVHQIELEMQNEELRRTQVELNAERASYADLYDNAPMGYCSVSQQGLIVRANHFMAAMLGLARGSLIKQRLTRFISREDQDLYYLLSRSLAKSAEPRSHELRMLKYDGTPFWASLTANTPGDDSGQEIRIVLSDITVKIEQEQRRLLNEAALRGAIVREVHHRIKNNLQGVIGILDRFAARYPEMSTPMHQAMGQVQAISFVHGLQGSDITGSIFLCDLIRSIASKVQELWQTPVALDIAPKWSSWVLAEGESVPIALVMNELIVNAVKHGGRDHGGVELTLQNGPRDDLVQILIHNAGQLSDDHRLAGTRHSGLQLIAAMMPRSGARIVQDQRGDRVITMIELGAPVVSVQQLITQHQ